MTPLFKVYRKLDYPKSNSTPVLLYSIPPGKERFKKVLAKARELLREGEVIYFPTDTLPGLLAWVSREDAVRRVFRAKGRPREEPLPLGVRSMGQLLELLEIPERTLRAREDFIPGPLTVVGPARDEASLPKEVVKDGEVAVRVPGYPPLLEVLEGVSPLTLTSANLHGQEPLFSPRGAMDALGGYVKYYFVDYRHRYLRTPSTIIRLTGDSFEVLREGAVAAEVLRERLHGR